MFGRRMSQDSSSLTTTLADVLPNLLVEWRTAVPTICEDCLVTDLKAQPNASISAMNLKRKGKPPIVQMRELVRPKL